MGFMKAQDTISGQEAIAYAIIDGQRREMFYIKSFEATIEKEKSEVKTLGKRGTQSKTNGWKGTGSMTMYYATSEYRAMTLKYIKTGVDTYFDIYVRNEDPTSSIGAQSCAIKNVNLDKIIIAKIDIDSTELDEDIDFTFDDVDLLDQFGMPVLG